jgi:hypothetical protein
MAEKALESAVFIVKSGTNPPVPPRPSLLPSKFSLKVAINGKNTQKTVKKAAKMVKKR